MWLWGAIDVGEADDGALEWGTDIEGFFEFCQRKSARFDFFNLKFDGGFIVHWLLTNGYTHVEREPDEGGPRRGEFTSLISNMGKWYSVTVKWPNGIITEFRDAAKKFPAGMGVAGVAKAYNLDVSKGEMDYHAERPVGYQPTRDELDYLDRDVRIVAKALAILFAAGLKRLTASSDALHEYRTLSGGTQAFRAVFPLLDEHTDEHIRAAYRGGWTYLEDRYKMQGIAAGIVFDVNSLYPSVMYNELIPYGLPKEADDLPVTTPDYPLSIFTVTFTARLKRKHVACIQIKGTSIFGATEYLREIPEPTTITVTNVDWKLYNEQYNINVISYEGGYLFKAARGMFNDYIDKWMQVKATSKGGQREIAKGQLNNLYGKFATNPDVTGKIPTLEDDVVKYVTGQRRTKDPVYTAAGVFITAHARGKTIRAAQANYDRFVYADTDSIHLTGTADPVGIEIHDTALGAWKHEYYFTEALFVRPKVYLERVLTSGQMKVAFAGLPKKVASRLEFGDIVEGNKIPGKLQPASVEGGVVLMDVDYTIKL